jgi:nicotinamidase-related amidase
MMDGVAKSALLVMDVQNGVVERFAEQCGSLLASVGRATAAARRSGTPVIYVRVAFRLGGPEISRHNLTFGARATTGGVGADDQTTQVHPSVAPHAEDIIVVKKRVSAFTGSDLDVVLRSQEIGSLVLTGISTSGVVLSTLRQAADLDFELVVLRDACADADAEVHRVLLDKVFPRQATVLSTDEWVAATDAAPTG